MCRRRTTHAQCTHAMESYHDEWWDKWGNAHEITIIECSENGCHPGKHFNINDVIDRDCQAKLDGEAWARIVAEQAANE